MVTNTGKISKLTSVVLGILTKKQNSFCACVRVHVGCGCMCTTVCMRVDAQDKLSVLFFSDNPCLL